MHTDKNIVNTYFQLLNGEPSTSTDSAIVLVGWASDDWSQVSSHGARSNRTSLLQTGISPPLFTCRLVEPGTNSDLPILVEMRIRHYVVTLRGHGGTATQSNNLLYRSIEHLRETHLF